MIDIFKRIKKALWILRNGTPLKCPSCNSKNLRYVGFESNAGTKTGFELTDGKDKRRDGIMSTNIRLIHGDCIEEMQKMGDESVDFTLTDIPYSEVSRECNGLRN